MSQPSKSSHSQLSASQTAQPGVFVKTFGCQMNEYDSEKMLQLLSSQYRAVSSAEEAEVVLVNTCSVRDKAEHKLFSLLGLLAEMKASKPSMVIGVGGCVAQQEGARIAKRNKSVDFVFGTHNLSLVPDLVAKAKAGAEVQIAVDYRDEWEELPDEFDAAPRVEGESRGAFGLHNTPVRALVAIQRGCDKMCSYCVVPNTRGTQVSRSLAEIEKEVRLKIRAGAREVLLLGQTVNSYGIDLEPRVRFEALIRRLAEIEGLQRIRFTSPHPAEVRREFIELYGSIPQLCPHIHLPLQSGSDRILKLMNRNYRRERYLRIVDQIRSRVPNIAITSDIIVGFPTETEEDFEQTLAIMREVKYSSSYSFKYSTRPHTTAKENFSAEEEIPNSIAGERLTRLQELQCEHSEEFNRQWLGQRVDVLVEGHNKKLSFMRGRIPQNTLLEIVEGAAKPGETVSVRVTHSSPNALRGVVLEIDDEKREHPSSQSMTGSASPARAREKQAEKVV